MTVFADPYAESDLRSLGVQATVEVDGATAVITLPADQLYKLSDVVNDVAVAEALAEHESVMEQREDDIDDAVRDLDSAVATVESAIDELRAAIEAVR